jgi:hypothetical protein
LAVPKWGTALDHYIVVAVGPHSPTSTEMVVATATEALAQVAVQRRLCGRSGTVEVLGRGGRKIGEETLMRAAAGEADGIVPGKPFERR